MRIFAIILAFLAAPAFAQTIETTHGEVRVETVASGFDRPWALAFLPNGDVLVTEKFGRISRVTPGGAIVEIAGAPEVAFEGQGGLLDLVLASDFEESGEIYVSYSARADGGLQTRVARARLDGDRLTDLTVIFRQEPAQRTGRHFGSRIVVATDGSLFITVGDRGEPNGSQDLTSHQGSVIRILRDGAPHPDNPFIDNGRGWRPEIYSYGHRNPQGATLGADGELWTVEHGAAGGDEINRPEGGRNYGWPIISYGRNYSGSKIGVGSAAEGMEQPVYYWDPSIAPSGLAFYQGDMFPDWRGDLLVGALKFQLLSRLDLENSRVVGEEQMLQKQLGRIRDVRVAPDGSIWLLTDARNASLYRLSR
ncbi:MAG: PQQ-dependent sugar dehydrogenase [Pseudomonadota bacterium]